jgi:hypothetical protein
MGKQSPSNHGEGNPEAADRFNTPDLVAARGTEGRMSEGPGLFRENEDGFGLMMSWTSHHKVCKRTVAWAAKQR